MSTITIRGIAQEIYDQFCQLAEVEGVSLNAEALVIFEEGVKLRIRRNRKEALRMADESRVLVGVDSLELLHEGREERLNSLLDIHSDAS